MAKNKEYTTEDLQRVMNMGSSSNFNGFDQVSADGSENDLLDFKGASSLKDPENSRKRIAFTVTNSTTSDKIVVISDGGFDTSRISMPDGTSKEVIVIGGGSVLPSAAKLPPGITDIAPVMTMDNIKDMVEAGMTVDCVLDNGVEGIVYKDGTGAVTIGYNKGSSPRQMRNYLAQGNALHIYETHISSDEKAVFQSKFEITEVSPLQRKEVIDINFEDAYKPSNNLEGKIIVEQGFIMSNRTLTQMRVPASSSVSVTLMVSTEANVANTLEKVVSTYKKNEANFLAVRK